MQVLKSGRPIADLSIENFSVRQLLDSLLNGGIPPSDPRLRNPVTMRRVRTAVGCNFALVVSAPGICVFYWFIGAPLAAAGVAVATLVGVIALVLGRVGVPYPILIHTALLTLVALLAFLFAQVGGLHAMGQGWLWVPAITAGLLRGVGAATGYGALAILQLAILAALEHAGVTLPQTIPPAMRTTYAFSIQVLLGGVHVALVTAFVSAQRTAERALLAARDAAESGLRAKAEFLANMSHEIRTPMNGVIGMLELLDDTLLTREQREFVTAVRTSGDALLTIINDILDFSKLESGRIELEAVPISVRDCLAEVLELLGPKAAEKGIELAGFCTADVPRTILGDHTRLRQILTNLVGNAIKFTRVGEVLVTVEAGVGEAGSTALRCAVRDSGIGIPADRMHRLFQSFSQVDASTTRSFGGTGLGLAISKRLVEAMGGTLTVESAEGVGSTFQFTLRGEAVASPIPASDVAPADLTGRRLLIVDDNTTTRHIVCLEALGWGMTPREAASAAEAMAWVRDGGTFDVAVVDLHMPDVDGIELARALSRIPEAADRPLVLLSSAMPSEVRSRMAALEHEGRPLFSALLAKPVRPDRLERALAEALGLAQTSAILAASARVLLTGSELTALRVLLAEDHAINRVLALATLQRLGIHADTAEDGVAALEALQARDYDVVLMDVQMPRLDGLGATRRLRHELPSARQPYVIAVTANALEGDREACLAAGMDDYLAKPFHPSKLAAALERALAARRAGNVVPSTGASAGCRTARS